MDSTSPADLLNTAVAARRQTRLARQGYWFPTMLFGLIIMAAAPCYRIQAPHSPVPPGGGSIETGLSGQYGLFGGLLWAHPTAVSLYWLITLPAGYALTIWFYRRRGSRVGVTSPIRPYILTGVGLLVLLVLTSSTVLRRTPIGNHLPDGAGALFVRGLTPVLVVTVGLLVLAWLERSPGFAAFTAAAFIVTVVSALYNVERPPGPHPGQWSLTQDGSDPWGLLPFLWAPGILITVGGVAAGLAALRRARNTR